MAISITCIDTLYYTPTLEALKRTIKTLGDKVTKVYWFSDIDIPEDVSVPVTWVIIPKIKVYNDDYSYVTLKLCPEVCVEDFNLIIHADGFAVNADAWTDEFLKYDYIGARWQDGFVGNGGFCLRSRKLYDAFISMNIKNLSKDYSEFLTQDFFSVMVPTGERFVPEDNIICKIHKGVLENQYGIKFAPVEVADRFSVEHICNPIWLGKSLGFHGKHGIAEHYGVKL
jgi:hypothetical protein